MNHADQKSIVYRIEGVFLLPLHELIHYVTGLALNVPIDLHADSVTFKGATWTKNMLITLAPFVFSLAFGAWAVLSFLASPQSISSIVILTAQLGYALLHIQACGYDLHDALNLTLELGQDLIDYHFHDGNRETRRASEDGRTPT